MTDHIPPQNLEAEQSTLGSMMIEQSALEDVRSMLSREDFYRPAHQDIYAALCSLSDRNEPLDILTVSDELRKQGKFDDCGGAEYLMALAESVPTAANVEHYAKIVKHRAALRQMIAAGTEIAGLGYNEEDDLEKLRDRAQQIIARVVEVKQSNLVRFGDYAHEYTRVLEERKHKGDDGKLFDTGFPTINNSFTRFGDGKFVLLKGLRKTGKTHFAVHWPMKCIEAGRAAIIYSVEMTIADIVDRAIAYAVDEDSRRFKRMSRDDDWTLAMEGCAKLYDSPLWINDSGDISVDMIRAQCRGMVMRGIDLGLVVIDYSELVGEPGKHQTTEDHLARNARQLANMCKELDCTVVLLSQVNEQGMERGSRGIGNRADLLLHIDADDEQPDRLYLRSDGNRFGQAFRLVVEIDKRTSRMRELTDEYGNPPPVLERRNPEWWT